jgi:hypothetical protein
VAALSEFRALGLFSGADLRRAVFVVVVVLPVLPSASLVSIVWPIWVADGAVLQIISNSILLQQYVEESLTISVTGI